MFFKICYLGIFKTSSDWLDDRIFKSLLNRVPCVPYVPTWSTCQRAHVPMCHKRVNFSFLRANVPACQVVLIFKFGVPTCQKACHVFNFACQKVGQFFNYFSKELYFFIYLINLYLIYFTYFVYFKYITNIYFYMNIFLLPNFIHHV